MTWHCFSVQQWTPCTSVRSFRTAKILGCVTLVLSPRRLHPPISSSAVETSKLEHIHRSQEILVSHHVNNKTSDTFCWVTVTLPKRGHTDAASGHQIRCRRGGARAGANATVRGWTPRETLRRLLRLNLRVGKTRPSLSWTWTA